MVWDQPSKGHYSGSAHLFPESRRRCHRPAEGARPPPLGGGVIVNGTDIPQPTHRLPDGLIKWADLTLILRSYWAPPMLSSGGNCSQSELPQGHIIGVRRKWGSFSWRLRPRLFEPACWGTSCQSKGCDPMGEAQSANQRVPARRQLANQGCRMGRGGNDRILPMGARRGGDGSCHCSRALQFSVASVSLGMRQVSPVGCLAEEVLSPRAGLLSPAPGPVPTPPPIAQPQRSTR